MIEFIHLQNFNFLGISLDISFTVHSSRAINPTPITSTKKPSRCWRNGSGYQLRCSPVSVSASTAWCVRGIFDAANHSPPSLPLILYWPFGPFTHCRPAQSCCQSHSEYTTIEDWSLVVGVHIDISSTLGRVSYIVVPFCDETHLMYQI